MISWKPLALTKQLYYNSLVHSLLIKGSVTENIFIDNNYRLAYLFNILMPFYSIPMHELVRTIIHKSLCVIIAHFIRYYKQSETYTEDKQTSSKLTSLLVFPIYL